MSIPQVPLDDCDAVPLPLALPVALSAIQDAAMNEETQFGNLNTRGVAILSATSLVTALAGLYGKDLLGGAYAGWRRQAGISGLIVTLVFLSVVAVVVVVGVLTPRKRLFFGGNDLTDHPSRVATPSDVQEIAFKEYRQIYAGLRERNQKKALALTWAYGSFLAAVISIAATVAIITIANG